MAKEYSLNLYENAIDSLNEGMLFYRHSLNDVSKYKFCIILVSNFMELILKHLVEMQNFLLCYEKPYSNNINKEKTVTWKQSLQILTNCKIIVEKKLINDIERLSDFRNKIIHYKFEYNTSDIRDIIIKVVDGLRKLYKNVTSKDIVNDVSESTKEILKIIEDEYLTQLHLAQSEAKEYADEKEISVVDCGLCGESETAVENENNELYCYFCKETDSLVECRRCTELDRRSEMEYWGKDEYGDDLYFCQYCNDLLTSDD